MIVISFWFPPQVDYFRGKDFLDFMLKHDKILKRHCQPALDSFLDSRLPADEGDVVRIGTEMIKKGFFVRAIYRPLEGTEDSGKSGGKKKKWPDRLVRRPKETEFDCSGFYILEYEGSHTMR